MRPVCGTAAHTTDKLAEIVCSNSLKSELESTPAGLLKADLKKLDSLLINVAEKNRVPAGRALAVDRGNFASEVTAVIENLDNVTVIREEVAGIPEGYDRVIVATGPLTSDNMAESLQKIFGSESLYFYDAIAPIVEADSIDYSIAFVQDRYGEVGEGDYLNLPMSKEEYEKFLDDLLSADAVPFRDFERDYYFDGCLPIEEIASRGRESLAFGPLKPVGLSPVGLSPDGLSSSAAAKMAHAVIQLRKENVSGDAYNMVGFQTKLSYPEQERVFRTIPGLQNAKFLRLGSLHRNTYINSPSLLNIDLSLKSAPNIRLAGQMTGVEGYVESIATGLLAGLFTVCELVDGASVTPPPPTTTLGALLAYIAGASENPLPSGRFCPANMNFSLFPPLPTKVKRRKERRAAILERADSEMKKWIENPSEA